MSDEATAYSRAAILIIAPVVMLVGFLYHPHIGNPMAAEFLPLLAAAVVASPARWAVAHLLVAVGSGLMVLAFLAVRGRLREEGEDRWSRPALPFVVMGSVLYGLLPAMEFAPLAVARTGASLETIAATQGALLTWFVPVLLTSAVLFLVGAVGFAIGLVRSAVLGTPLARLVAVALVAMAVTRFIPLSAVQFHAQGLIGLVALWPLAYAMVGLRRARPLAASWAGAAAVAGR
jgi:hypothetical protein